MKKQNVNKTYTARPQDITPQWFVVDAADAVLGRLASKVAAILCGKNKPTYTPHIDTGDYVIIINAEKVHVTGQKATKKTYISHSGFPGGYRERSFKEVRAKHPERIIEKAVKGMLPKTSLSRHMILKLKVYAGSEYLYSVQQPTAISL